MTVYVQYHWEESEEESEIEVTHPAIITAWTGSGETSEASSENNYLIKHAWEPNLGFRIVTDNIMVTDIEQIVNVMHVTVREE